MKGSFFCGLFFFICMKLFGAIPVTDNFEHAQEIGKAYRLPIVLVFLGSDWSTVSEKFLEDFLQSDTIAQKLKKEFIFVQVDFPEINNQSPELIEQNHDLKVRYGVETFPTIILLEADGQELSREGYDSKQPDKCSDFLLDQIHDYRAIHFAIDHDKMPILEEEMLEYLYKKAKAFNLKKEMSEILDAAVKNEKGIYLMMEKYTSFVNEKKTNTSKARHLRRRICAKDAKNERGALTRLAILDFQQAVGKGNIDPEKAIGPLLKHTEKHPKDDEIWRVKMIIADFLAKANRKEKALEYAQSSYNHAPSAHKEEIGELIEIIASMK